MSYVKIPVQTEKNAFVRVFFSKLQINIDLEEEICILKEIR